MRRAVNEIQTWLALIADSEPATYSSLDMSRSIGNRAKRATNLEHVDLSIDNIDYTNAPEIECQICCDKGPGCFVFRADPNISDENLRDAIEMNGRDYCMNFPLACGKNNLVFLSSDNICVKCARYMYRNGGTDTVRSKITGVLPVASFGIPNNHKYFTQVLAHALTEGKHLSHLSLLFFALLDQLNTKEWAQDKKL